MTPPTLTQNISFFTSRISVCTPITTGQWIQDGTHTTASCFCAHPLYIYIYIYIYIDSDSEIAQLYTCLHLNFRIQKIRSFNLNFFLIRIHIYPGSKNMNAHKNINQKIKHCNNLPALCLNQELQELFRPSEASIISLLYNHHRCRFPWRKQICIWPRDLRNLYEAFLW